ncbi:MAG: radical SAM protein [Candidatus Omnitrophota bacterium]
MEIQKKEIKRILNPTSIDLGDYVINPYKGCQYACLYCYVRFNKVTLKDKREWGSFVDVRINGPELLERELKQKKPQKVLLGSTTDCFQPCEQEYGLTRKILEILNKNKIYYTILTRSPEIIHSIPILKKGYCNNIYFTVNCFSADLKGLLEPKSPAFKSRVEAMRLLNENKIPVVPYISPVLPHITEFDHIFSWFPFLPEIESEGLNFNLGNIEKIILEIKKQKPEIGKIYENMHKDSEIYKNIWQKIKTFSIKAAIKHKKKHKIFIHRHNAYFHNTYT